MTLFRRNAHLKDGTLLLLVSGELPVRQERAAAAHLSGCSTCRLRRWELMSAEECIRPADEGDRRGGEAARERLAASLLVAASAAEHSRPRQAMSLVASHPGWLLRAGAVMALLVGAVAFRQLELPLQDRMAAWEDTGPEPNRQLTPGAASPVSLQQVCSRSDDDLDPKLPPEKEQAVFRAYGIRPHAARGYQVDYLINPQLGGNDELANLWPEPYHATVWNAKAKDALEARLHAMVCGGQIELDTAQRELASDWIAAYKKYFHATRPVSTVAQADEAPALRR